MLVRKQSNGQVMTEGEFRQVHSNTSFPSQLSASLLSNFGFDPVLEGAQPPGEPWQYPVRDGVEAINGQWFTKYILGPTFASQAEEDAYVAEWQTQQGLSAQPVPRLVASGVFAVNGSWPDSYIESVGAASGISAVFPIDVGIYWLFFNEPQPDLAFAVYASSSAGQVNIPTRTIDYIELWVKDGTAPFDPLEFSVNIVRSST
jgi:hypothetical protein